MKKITFFIASLLIAIGAMAQTTTIDVAKTYTLECQSPAAHSTARFIGVTNGVIDGQSAIGAEVKFEAAAEGSYYIIVGEKYINYNGSALVASAEASTAWVFGTVGDFVTFKVTETTLYLNNNQNGVQGDGTITNLKANNHPGGPTATNYCSTWRMIKYVTPEEDGEEEGGEEEANKDFENKMIASIGAAATSIEATQWYILYNQARGCYVSEEGTDFRMRSTSNLTVNADATEKAGYLFRFEATGNTNEYYIKSGNGLHFAINQGSSTVSTEPVAYIIAQIGDNAGHFYGQMVSDGRILDGNANGGTLAGWTTTIPTSTGGNNDYQFLPVTFVDKSAFIGVTYNFTYGGQTKFTQTAVVAKGAEFPEINIEFPLGVTATKPTGTVSAENATQNIELSVNLPFEYAASYEEITKWYYLTVHATDNKYVHYNPSGYLDASTEAVDVNREKSYIWAFVGDPFNGFSIVNGISGKNMVLTSNEPTADATLPYMASKSHITTQPTVWDLKKSEYGDNGFLIAYDGTTTCLNRQEIDGTLKICYRLNGTDEGSTFFVEECEIDNVETPEQPNVTAGEFIDLGLSVKWGACNINASSPYELGEYFLWSQEDIAQTELGGKWYMPTLEEAQELINECTWEWTSLNGMYGYKVIGPNGNSIFMAASGWIHAVSGKLVFFELEGNYWTSTYNGGSYAYDIEFTEPEGVYMDPGGYIEGWQVVRPVYRDEQYELNKTIATAEALQTTVNANIGTIIGNYSQETANALAAAITEAKAVTEADAEDVAALQAAIDGVKKILPTAGKYYQFHSAYQSFENPVAVYSNGTNVRWAVLDNSNKGFFWQAEEVDGNIVLKNVADSKYMVGNTETSQNWSVADAATEQSVMDVEIIDANDANNVIHAIVLAGRHMHAANSNNGDTKESTVVSWETNSANSCSSWYIKEVSNIDYLIAKASLQNRVNELNDIVSYTGTNPGQYKATETAKLVAPIATAEEVLNSGSATPETYVQALNTLNSAIEGVDLSINPVVEGTYMIVSAASAFSDNTRVLSCYGYDNEYNTHRTPAWAPINANDPLQYWTLEDAGNGTFNIKATYEGNYITTATSMSATAAAATITSLGSAQFNINIADDGLIHAQGWNWNDHMEGGPLTTWEGGANTPSAWKLIAVTEPEFTHTLTVSDAGYATLMLAFNATIPTGVECYYATHTEGDVLKLAAVEGTLPAKTPVIVKAAADEYIFTSTDATATVEGNILSGTLYPKNVTPTGIAYVLSAPEGNVGLYQAELANGTFLNNANKVYFDAPAAAGIASYSFGFDWAGTTGIEGVAAEGAQDGAIYDITGRQVKAITAPGIYIINGKKVVK